MKDGALANWCRSLYTIASCEAVSNRFTEISMVVENADQTLLSSNRVFFTFFRKHVSGKSIEHKLIFKNH